MISKPTLVELGCMVPAFDIEPTKLWAKCGPQMLTPHAHQPWAHVLLVWQGTGCDIKAALASCRAGYHLCNLRDHYSVPGYDRTHQPWALRDPHAHQPWALRDPHAHQPWALCAQ